MTCFVAGSFTPEMMGYGGFATRHLYSGIFKLSMIVNSTEPGKLVTEEEEDNPPLLLLPWSVLGLCVGACFVMAEPCNFDIPL